MVAKSKRKPGAGSLATKEAFRWSTSLLKGQKIFQQMYCPLGRKSGNRFAYSSICRVAGETPDAKALKLKHTAVLSAEAYPNVGHPTFYAFGY